MNHENIIVESFGPITKVFLNRPEKHNALSLGLMTELCEVLQSLKQTDCQVVILGGYGVDFCSGLDLKEASEESLIESMGKQLACLLTLLHETTLVTIAAVHGHALAGGGGIAASCDLLLLTENAKMGFPETRKGIVAAQVAVVLMEQISLKHVKGLLLTGGLIDSRKAMEIGLAHAVVPEESLQEEALKIANQVLRGAPNAIKETKKLIKNLSLGDFTKNLSLALSVHHAARHSDEGKEGIASFLEKRPPKWL